MDSDNSKNTPLYHESSRVSRQCVSSPSLIDGFHPAARNKVNSTPLVPQSTQLKNGRSQYTQRDRSVPECYVSALSGSEPAVSSSIDEYPQTPPQLTYTPNNVRVLLSTSSA